MPASEFIQPALYTQVVPRGQQQPRWQQISYVVVDNQHPGTSRQLHFTISPTKIFNPMSVASVTGEDRAHNISGLCSIFGNIEPIMSYPQIETLQLLTPSDLHQRVASPSTTRQQEPPQQAAKPQSPSSHLSPSINSSSLTAPTYKGSFQDHICKMFFSGQLLIHRSFSGPPNLLKTINKLRVKKIPKQKTFNFPHQTHDTKTQEIK